MSRNSGLDVSAGIFARGPTAATATGRLVFVDRGGRLVPDRTTTEAQQFAIDSSIAATYRNGRVRPNGWINGRIASTSKREAPTRIGAKQSAENRREYADRGFYS